MPRHSESSRQPSRGGRHARPSNLERRRREVDSAWRTWLQLNAANPLSKRALGLGLFIAASAAAVTIAPAAPAYANQEPPPVTQSLDEGGGDGTCEEGLDENGEVCETPAVTADGTVATPDATTPVDPAAAPVLDVATAAVDPVLAANPLAAPSTGVVPGEETLVADASSVSVSPVNALPGAADPSAVDTPVDSGADEFVATAPDGTSVVSGTPGGTAVQPGAVSGQNVPVTTVATNTLEQPSEPGAQTDTSKAQSWKDLDFNPPSEKTPIFLVGSKQDPVSGEKTVQLAQPEVDPSNGEPVVTAQGPLYRVVPELPEEDFKRIVENEAAKANGSGGPPSASAAATVGETVGGQGPVERELDGRGASGNGRGQGPASDVSTGLPTEGSSGGTVGQPGRDESDDKNMDLSAAGNRLVALNSEVPADEPVETGFEALGDLLTGNAGKAVGDVITGDDELAVSVRNALERRSAGTFVGSGSAESSPLIGVIAALKKIDDELDTLENNDADMSGEFTPVRSLLENGGVGTALLNSPSTS